MKRTEDGGIPPLFHFSRNRSVAGDAPRLPEYTKKGWIGVYSVVRINKSIMKLSIPLTIFCLLVSAQSFTGCASRQEDANRDALLSLRWQQFDQTLNSGWRVYSVRQEYRAAADVIEVYLHQHQELTVRQRAVSHFHAGLMRVRDGRTQAGLAHMRQALVPDNTEGLSDDWNDMVSARIAFLTGDRAQLVRLKERVAGLPPSRVEWPGCPADLLEHFGEPFGSWKSN